MGGELLRYVGKTKLDSTLVLIGNMIRGMFKRNKPVITVPVRHTQGLLHQAGNITVTAWNLSDLAYLAIRESSDFETWTPSIHDLMGLYNLFLAWDDNRSKIEFEGLTSDDWTLKFAVGFSQKQFWYQELYRIRQEFNRQVELLEVIPTEIGSQIDLSGACTAVTGFDLRTFRTILLALFSVADKRADLTHLTSDGTAKNFHPALTVRNVQQVATLYAADYQEFRQSPLQENHFYLKPIVRTTSNRLIAANTYMFAKKVADGPFWIIREHYRVSGSQAFVTAFGEYFERYVEKLLQRCLPSNYFTRVPPPKTGEFADWFVFTKNYRLIVEVKSSLAALMIRRLYPDIEAIKTYLQKFQKGVIQLDSTAQAYQGSSKTTIKLLVHFEVLYFSDGVLRPMVVQAVRNQLTDNKNIYFCDIGEFEWFISLLGRSESVAESVLEAKIGAESQPGTGREFAQIIPQVTDISNLYMDTTLNYWDTYWHKDDGS